MANKINGLDIATIIIVSLFTTLITLKLQGLAESTTKTITLKTPTGIVKTEQHLEVLNNVHYQYSPEGIYKKVLRKKPYKFVHERKIIEGKVVKIQ